MIVGRRTPRLRGRDDQRVDVARGGRRVDHTVGPHGLDGGEVLGDVLGGVDEQVAGGQALAFARLARGDVRYRFVVDLTA